MCGGNPIRDIFRVMQTAQPRPQMAPERPRRPQAAVQAPPAAPKIACPTCGTQVDARFSWCPSCGSALKAQTCEFCGQTLAPEDASCPSCGAPRSRRRR